MESITYPLPLRAAALALIVSCLASPEAWSQPWRVYANERFGTSADVPATWKSDPPPENGDGLVFRSPDGLASITVSGSLHATATVAEEMRIFEEPEPGEKITSRERGSRSLILTGRRGDVILYAKHLLSCSDQVWNNLTIEYPARQKAMYEPLVAHVAKSLRPGRSAQVEECNK